MQTSSKYNDKGKIRSSLEYKPINDETWWLDQPLGVKIASRQEEGSCQDNIGQRRPTWGLMMPYVETIESTHSYMGNIDLVLCGENGSDISTHQPQYMHSYYKMLKPREYDNTQFYTTWENISTKEIIKS